MQMIKPGANIEVQSRGVRQRGLFRAVTEEGLSLSTGTGELSLLRTEITRVKVRKRNFARRIGIGALIGAAAGFAISFAVASGIARNEGNSANGYVVLGGAIAGIGIGSGAGALVGLLPGYDTVYDASRAARH